MKTTSIMAKMAEVARCNMTRSIRLANSVANSGKADDIALAEQILKHAEQVTEDMACNLNFLIPGFKREKFLDMCPQIALSVRPKKTIEQIKEAVKASADLRRYCFAHISGFPVTGGAL